MKYVLKKKIIKLKKQVKFYEQELTRVCPHKNISRGFDKYLYKDDYLFICDDCGMNFVTDDPDFRI